MSRVGKQPIKLPDGVTVNLTPATIAVSGPKGSLELRPMPGISLTNEGGLVIISRTNHAATTRARHGLMRALIANMVQGVSQGYEIKLELHGVGFKVQAEGEQLKFNLGFSHQVVYKVPTGVSVTVEQNTLTVSGPDKQLVGQVAAEIRSLRKPEPYKGKGIKYADERLIRKSGKSGKETAGA
ncbi:50S ribosomal protein L6 [Candidatus Saccharibacteria bacterium]|nr:50S ribosomal protein L6 [Candidatus Saccharibacteria bacterium]